MSLIEQYAQALADCRNLYVDGARECVRQCPEQIAGDPAAFVELMDDLHRGLLAKVYVTVANADKQWSPAEEQYAAVLCEHLWHQRLSGPSLREAMLHITRQTAGIKWYALFRPFDKLPPLKDLADDLYSIVMRVANLVAKADGEVVAAEAAALTEIRANLMEIQGVLQFGMQPGQANRPAESLGAPPVGEGQQALELSPFGDRQTRSRQAQAVQPPCEDDLPSESLEDVLRELDRLVGIEPIKQEVRTLANFLRVQKRRLEAGLPATPVSLHMVFSGNPGTGKTTVARIVGRALRALAVLAKGHVVEIDRSGLVAEYAGQTAVKTNKTIDGAMDGILFLDEAYSLVAESGDDPYGSEAVQIVLKRMEDNRERLVVILAGYPEPMDRLLKSNPGLSSRFSHHIEFPDYSPVELGQIFEIFCRRNRYELPPNVRAKLLLGFQWWFENRDEHFGNGRAVRNAFELAIRRLANRVIGIMPLTVDALTTLQPDDVSLPDVPETVWDHLENEDRQFRVTCTACGKQSPMLQKYLGHQMKCAKCGQPFVAGWGQPDGG